MEELDEDEQEDSFDKIYKGEVSKSGTAILPSKRLRRIPEKITSAISEKKNETNNEDEVLEKEETNQETVEKKSE